MSVRTRHIVMVLLVILGLSGCALASTTGAVVISGSEQSTAGIWDIGTVTVTVNNHSETVFYGQYSTVDSIASAIAAKFSSDCNGPTNARSAAGGTILFQTRGSSALTQLSVTTSSTLSFTGSSNTSILPTTTTATIGSTVVAPGQSTVVNVQVSCGSACGLVDYRIDGGEWGTVSLDGSGHFSAATGTNWAAGLHNVVVKYQGNGTFMPSTSNPVSFTITSSAGGPPTPIYSYSISSYAANGNISAYTDSVNGSWSDIQYDGLNRLAAATTIPVGGSTQYQCWTYDSFGNRTSQTLSATPCNVSSPPLATTQAQYNAKNQITETNLAPQGLTYDAAGNVTDDGTNQYLYDAEGRICAVGSIPPTGGMQMTQYIYDARGERVAKGTISTWSCDTASNGFTETAGYVLGPNGEQITEVDGSGTWVHTNVYAAGQLIATYNPQGLHFHLADWLGSRRVQTDFAGVTEATYKNLPFGEMIPQSQNLGATQQHFTGKERDAESGNDYFGARYYGSNMGRFLSPDWAAKAEPVPYAKLDDPQSLNLYVYVLNNPLISSDPSGHQTSGTSSQVLGACQFNASGPSGCYQATIKAQQPHAPAQQQSQSTTATGDPIQTDLQKDVPGVSTVTPQPDANLDKPHGGHQNETFALTFKTPKEQAAFLKEAGRKGLFHKDSGFGPGVRLDGGLHAEHGRLDPTNPGAILVTSHIDRFNPNNGLGPMIGHFVVDVGIGSTFCSSSACLDH